MKYGSSMYSRLVLEYPVKPCDLGNNLELL